jgi:N6-adenosine-specific RNA methylase IME4
MDIVTRESHLPATVEELHKFILIGKETLKAHKARIRAIEKVASAHAAKEAALQDAQDVADLVLDAEVKLGEMLEAIDKPKFNGSIPGTIGRATTKSLPPEITKKISHQAQTIKRNPDIIEQVRQRVRKEKRIATAQEVYKEIKAKERQERNDSLEPQPLPEGLFSVIYADPPWQYEHVRTTSRQVENQYPTMTLDKIKVMEIPATEDCVLFLWTTAPKLEESLEVLAAWGFSYRTHAIWDKEIIGMGYWFRGQHELLLVATKGNPSPPQPENRLPSVFCERRGGHSKKPEFIYGKIEAMFPRVERYLELFARVNDRQKWELWGNE